MKQQSQEIIDRAIKNNVITKSEINLLCRRLNKGEVMDVSEIWDNPAELTAEQNAEAINFLRNEWKTPKGKERLNSPFGYREEEIIDNFRTFELAGFYDASKYGGRTFYIPLYNCVSNEGRSFQYYYDGKVQIVG
jgi:hypothetical protein